MAGRGIKAHRIYISLVVTLLVCAVCSALYFRQQVKEFTCGSCRSSTIMYSSESGASSKIDSILTRTTTSYTLVDTPVVHFEINQTVQTPLVREMVTESGPSGSENGKTKIVAPTCQVKITRAKCLLQFF